MKKLSFKLITILVSIIFILLINSEVYADAPVDSTGRYEYTTKADGSATIVGITENYIDELNEGTQEVKQLNFPSSIDGKEVVGIYATNLREIEDLKLVTIPDSVKAIGANVFSDCESLTNVSMKYVEIIGANAFYNCKSLTGITIPENTTSIGELAFANCASLREVTISKNIEYLKSGTFQNCTSLKEVNFGKEENGETKIKYIGYNAFENCKALEKITLPKSVCTVFDNAFERCNSLKEVIIKNKAVNLLGDNIFSLVVKDEHSAEHEYLNSNLTLKSYENSSASVYAEAHNIKFEASLMNQVEKAGILMAEFGKECADTYSTNFYYTLDKDNSVRKELVFSNKQGNVGYEGLTLECVGTLNFFVYQSTGLWSSNFDSSDPVYVKPAALVADDIFETILDGAIYTKAELKTLYENGDLQQGDVIRLNDGFRHVAMCCGYNGSKLLIPEGSENYNSHHLFFSNFGSWICRGQIYRIKEEAANKLTFLEDMDSVEEITEYAKALVLAYMDGQTTYNGEILKRKTTDKCKIELEEKEEEKIEDLIEEEVIIESSNGEQIKEEILTNIKQGTTVEQIMALDLPDGYSSKKIFNQYGGDVTNEAKYPISTGMKVVYYANNETGRAIDVSVGGEIGGKEHTLVIYGDVTGKGNPSALDSLTIVKNKIKKIPFKDPIYNIAGRVTEESRKNQKIPTSVDAYAIVRAKMGKYKINQGKFAEDTTEQPIIADYDDNVIPIYTREELEKVGTGEEVLIEAIEEVFTMNPNAKYVLMRDIDLSDSPWTPIGLPEEISETGEVIRKSTILTNSFEGNDHKITGMEITGEQTTRSIGLFSVCAAKISHLTLENLNIHDLTISDDIPNDINVEKSKFVIGSIVGHQIGNGKEDVIYSCKSSGKIESPILISNVGENITTEELYEQLSKNIGIVGGIVGYLYNNKETKNVISFCENNTELNGFFASGILAIAEGNVEIYKCENNGKVAGTNWKKILEDFRIGSSGNGAYIAGILSTAQDGTIIINGCVNNGELVCHINNENVGNQNSFFIGGIMSYVKNEEINITIKKCINKMDIVNSTSSGIIVYADRMKELNIIDCINEGNIENNYSYAAGIISRINYTLQDSEEKNTVNICNCKNLGEIRGTGYDIGGIIGSVQNTNMNFIKNENEGDIIGGMNCVSGLIGYIHEANLNAKECNNKGNIKCNGSNSGNIGGIIGYIWNGNTEIENCNNMGNINGHQVVGGIVAQTSENSASKIINCENSGTLEIISSHAGGILGVNNARKNIDIENCKNSGNIKGISNIRRNCWNFFQ